MEIEMMEVKLGKRWRFGESSGVGTLGAEFSLSQAECQVEGTAGDAQAQAYLLRGYWRGPSRVNLGVWKSSLGAGGTN
jgi:hypothetical protein